MIQPTKNREYLIKKCKSVSSSMLITRNQTLQFINRTWKQRTEFASIEESRRIRQNDLRVAVAIELETLENWGRLDEAREEQRSWRKTSTSTLWVTMRQSHRVERPIAMRLPWPRASKFPWLRAMKLALKFLSLVWERFELLEGKWETLRAIYKTLIRCSVGCRLI